MATPDMDSRESLIAALEDRTREAHADEPPDCYDIPAAVEYWRTLSLDDLRFEWDAGCV